MMDRDCQLYKAVHNLSEAVAGLSGTTGPTGPAGPASSSGLDRLSDGSVIVTTTACSASSVIQLSYIEPTANPGILSVSGITNGQFTIRSSNDADSSFVQWSIYQYPSSSVPVVSTGSLTTPAPLRFHCTGDVSSNGYSSITERGFVWSKTGIPTIIDNKEVASLGYGLGNYTHEWFDGATTQTYIRAYATNTNGTSYGDVVEGTPYICLARDTPVALADGTSKFIQDVVYDDILLVWDFDRGTFSTAPPLWIKHRETASRYNLLRFSNGAELRTIDQHRIFNKEKGLFSYPMTEDTPLGTTSFSVKGEDISLLHKSVIEEPVDYYNIITYHHMNVFTGGVLTSCRYNNIYPIRDMKFVTDGSRPVRDRDNTILDIYHYGLRLSEQLIPAEETRMYIKRLEQTEKKNILFLDHQGVMYLKAHPDNSTLVDFDPGCIQILNRMLEKDAHLEIVISSDWKYWVALDEMQEFYKRQGIKRAPIDYTPSTSEYNWESLPPAACP